VATVLTFRGSHADLRRLLAGVPAVMAGHAPDPLGIARGLQLRLSTVLLSKVQQDFLAKARGGAGADGTRWAPLAPSTLARRRQGPAGRRKKKGGKRPPPGPVEILRDTSRLLRSLTPGVDGRPVGPDQVVQTPPGRVIVGTNVKYAKWHQEGTSRMPARPIFPAAIPPAWWPAITAAGARGLLAAVAILVERRHRP